MYPFKTLDGKGERRSVAFNAQFVSKTEQDMFSERNPRPPNESEDTKDGSWVFHGSEYIWTANTDTT